jgi:hypothetical protein
MVINDLHGYIMHSKRTAKRTETLRFTALQRSKFKDLCWNFRLIDACICENPDVHAEPGVVYCKDTVELAPAKSAPGF